MPICCSSTTSPRTSRARGLFLGDRPRVHRSPPGSRHGCEASHEVRPTPSRTTPGQSSPSPASADAAARFFTPPSRSAVSRCATGSGCRRSASTRSTPSRRRALTTGHLVHLGAMAAGGAGAGPVAGLGALGVGARRFRRTLRPLATRAGSRREQRQLRTGSRFAGGISQCSIPISARGHGSRSRDRVHTHSTADSCPSHPGDCVEQRRGAANIGEPARPARRRISGVSDPADHRR